MRWVVAILAIAIMLSACGEPAGLSGVVEPTATPAAAPAVVPTAGATPVSPSRVTNERVHELTATATPEPAPIATPAPSSTPVPTPTPTPVTPSLDIEKWTNGHDADEAPGPEIPAGSPVEWEYVVANDGNARLTDIEVTDSVLGAVCTIAELAVGESATCTAAGTAEPGQYENLGTASFTYTDDSGNRITGSDEDYSHYLGTSETWRIAFVPRLPALRITARAIEIYFRAPDYEGPPAGGISMDLDLEQIPELGNLGGIGPVFSVPSVPDAALSIAVTRTGDSVSASFEFTHAPSGYTVTADLNGTVAGDRATFTIYYHLPAELQHYSFPLNYSDCMSEWEGTVYYSIPAELTAVYEGTVVGDGTEDLAIEGEFEGSVDGQFARWQFHEKEWGCRIGAFGESREQLNFDGITEWTFSNIRFRGYFRVDVERGTATPA